MPLFSKKQDNSNDSSLLFIDISLVTPLKFRYK